MKITHWKRACPLLLLALACVWHAPAPPASTQALCNNLGASLRAARRYPTGQAPRSPVISDFNRDGFTDVAVLDNEPYAPGIPGLSVYLGNGQGEFARAFSTQTEGGPVMAGGDFNGDGRLDLALGTTVGIAIWLGRGDGGFTRARFESAAPVTTRLWAADLNNDQRADLLVPEFNDNGLLVRLSLGDGSFARPVRVALSGQVLDLVAADFGGDGRLDLALLTADSRVNLLSGDGQGGFLTPTNFPLRNPGSALALGDFNGDNRPDLALGLTSGFGFLLSAGGGNFTVTYPASLERFGARGVRSVAAGDFNGDNRADVAFTSGSEDEYRNAVCYGNGQGDFSQPQSFGAPVSQLGAADFNRDQRADLLLLSSTFQQFSVLPGQASGGLLAPVVNEFGSAQIRAVTLADLNNDARPDVLASDPANGLAVALGDGAGAFGAAQSYGASVGIMPNTLAATVAGDFNRDGRVDVAALNSPQSNDNGTVTVLFGAATGGFDAARTRSFSAGLRPAALLAVELNRDNLLDLVIANAGSHDLTILLNNGAGGFTAAASVLVGLEPRSLAAGDFNGDGAADVAVANRNSAGLSLLLGDGRGGFNSMLFGLGANPRLVRAADFNRDGRLDLAVPHHNNRVLAVLLGNGAGGFAAPLESEWEQNINDLAVGDFNADGRLDLAATFLLRPDQPDSRVVVLAGDGAGRFALLNEYQVPVATEVFAADLNNDGLMDLAARSISTLWTWLNGCNPPPMQTVAVVPAATFSGFAVASDSIASVFGANLSSRTAAATTTPLPTELAGVTVSVRGRAAQLFFVSPNQINFVVPAGLASGFAPVTITNGAATATGTLLVNPVAPGLFTANANGRGAPVGIALFINTVTREQRFEPLAEFDTATGRFVPRTIELPVRFPRTDEVYLVLFGTGLRNHSDQPVRAVLGESLNEVVFAGRQGSLVGVDQVNVRLLQIGALNAEVDLTVYVDGLATNTVRVTFRR